MKDSRAKRLADFDGRARSEPAADQTLPSIGSYITVNPTADDEVLLERLHLTRESCSKVDCYWKKDNDVYFLQVQTGAYANREPGLWARLASGDPEYVNLVGIVRDKFVTRDALHRVMKSFSVSLTRTRKFDDVLTRIGAVED